MPTNDQTPAYSSEPPGKGWTFTGEGRWVKKGHPTVAVIGGGPAGLFAAYILNQKYPKAKITLFESSGRLGGKIKTDEFSDGTPFEAGVAELYEYLGTDGKDPLRLLIEEDLGLHTVDMSGGCVVLGEDVLRDHDELEERFGTSTRQQVERFHARCAELMPLEKYAHRWQPDNNHPWAGKTFHDCIHEECPDETACCYLKTAVHSDLATEPWTCNGLNGIKNVLMDNKDYMQLYHVVGGIERIVDRLKKKVKADVRLESRVKSIQKIGDDRYRVGFLSQGALVDEDFDLVILAMPNHWLSQISWGSPVLHDAMHGLQAHYDLPAHYLRVSLLYPRPWWNRLAIPGDYFMLDACNGMSCYNESHRWKAQGGHVLSFLLGGQDALLQCSANQDDDCVVQHLLDSLPEFMRQEAEDELVEAQVDRFAGSLNAQPGGFPVEELRGEHQLEPKEHPGIFLVGDFFFDSTLNAALISAATAVDCLMEYLGVEGKEGSEAVEELEPDGKGLAL